MSSLAISGIVFACIIGGIILGMLLRAFLPEKHLSAETKDLVKLTLKLDRPQLTEQDIKELEKKLRE